MTCPSVVRLVVPEGPSVAQVTVPVGPAVIRVATPGPPGEQGAPAPLKSVRIDSTATVIYVGKADVGTSESAAAWKITRTLLSAAGVEISRSTITGVTWTAHTSHTYP